MCKILERGLYLFDFYRLEDVVGTNQGSAWASSAGRMVSLPKAPSLKARRKCVAAASKSGAPKDFG